MTVEALIAIIVSVVSVCAGLCSIIVFAINRAKDKKAEGREEGTQGADLQYIKRRVDDILLDNKENNRQLIQHETRISLLESSEERLRNVPERLTNVYGSCTYVAMGMLLSFYDSYWDDSFIPEAYDVTTEFQPIRQTDFDIIPLDTESPGVLFESNELVGNLSMNQYLDIVNQNSDTYFQFKLIQLAKQYFGNEKFDTEAQPLGMNYSELQSFLNYYIHTFNQKSNSDVTINSATGTSGTVRNFTVAKLLNGTPVLLRAKNSDSDTGHAMIAYDYDSNTQEIYVHTGWKDESKRITLTHVSLTDLGYDVLCDATAIENFSISSSKTELIVDESMVLNVSIAPTKYQDKIEFEVKSGQDCISIVNNKVTAIKTGTATVVAKYKTFVSNELEIKIFDFRISLVDNIVKKGNHVKVKFNSYPTGGHYGCSFIIADPSVISLTEAMTGDVFVDGLSVGTTSFYLEKNGQRSNELTITVLDGNPYVNVDKNEFYANYTRSTSYQDSLYRTECDLMSGDITPQNQEPSISSNRPMSSGKYIRNSSQLYTNKNKTYTVLDSTGEKAFEVYRDSAYVGLEEVAAYIYAFGNVPCNYYEDRYDYPQPSQSIWGEYLRLNNSEFSGDVSSYPYEPKLPRIQGLGGDLIYYEVDIGTTGTDCDPKYPALNYNDGNTISRGAARIVYSGYYSDGMPIEDLNDRYVFYTYNHYNDFQEYLNYEGGWGEMFGNITGGGSISSLTNYNPTSYVQVIKEDFTSKEFNN